jgi:hypothetical protein
VYAPRSRPKSSLSISVEGSDAHSTFAHGVDRPRDQFLPRPRLARDQDRGVGRGDLFRETQDAPDRDAFSDDLLMRLGKPGLPPEITGFDFQQLIQPADFFVRTPCSFLQVFPFSDVHRNAEEMISPAERLRRPGSPDGEPAYAATPKHDPIFDLQSRPGL